MQNPALATPIPTADTTAILYVAELKHVTEVSLLGLSDLAFWRERLAREMLTPVERDGCAVIIIMAATMRFLGMRFSEVSVSVPVLDSDGGEAAFLLQGYNSNRLFAFCERTFFGTPYGHGITSICTDSPPSISLAVRGENIFQAQMQRQVQSRRREPLRIGEEGWRGRVFVPGKVSREPTGNRFFNAKIAGYTRAYAFEAGRDVFSIDGTAEHQALQSLRESHFVPREWLVREDATHAKSRSRRASAQDERRFR